MKTLKAFISMGAALTAILMPNAWADGPSTANAVFVGGTPIMRVRVAAGGYSARDRATEIQERVNTILGQGPVTATDITVASLGTEAVVRVKDQLLFTADWATARFNHTTPAQLATEWAQHMRDVLPGLTQAK